MIAASPRQYDGLQSAVRPNKPMVPTATNGLDEYAPDSLRRHIGRSLGGFEQRATKEQASGHDVRPSDQGTMQ